jgi:DNA-binding response OmpR family regulator
MKAKVLVVEDVREMAELIRLYLGREGIETELCETAEQALETLARFPFDLIVLDLNLPGMDGFEFLHEVRSRRELPVLIVSARDADEDIVAGLGIGADDYVTKPFSPKVLAARVRAHLRRSSGAFPAAQNQLRFGPFTLNLDAYLLRKEGTRIHLSAREFEVLAFLAAAAGKALAPEAIYRGVWKNEYGDLTVVAVYVQRLRRKIEDDPQNPLYIETVHGVGYRLNRSPVQRAGA